MGYTITPVLARTDRGFVPVDVPDKVATELAELYEYLTANPGQVGQVVFDKATEKDDFVLWAKSWAHESDGEVEFRQLPSKNLPDTQLRFTLRPPLTDEQKAANKAANEARKAKAAEKGK